LAKLKREKNCTIVRKRQRKEICDDRKIKKASLFATFFSFYGYFQGKLGK